MSLRPSRYPRFVAIACAATAWLGAARAEAQPAPEPPDTTSPPSSSAPTEPAPPTDASPSETPPPPSSAGGPVTIYVDPGAPPPVIRTAPPDAWAPVPPAPSDQPWIDRDIDNPYPQRGHFALRVGLGPTVESFHSERILMVGGQVAIGAETRRGSFFGVFGVDGGKTEQSLVAWQLHFAADLEWPIGPVRLGVEPRLGVLTIDRATTDSGFVYFTAGLGAILGIDLFHHDGFTLGLRAVPRVDYATEWAFLGPSDSTGVLGATALLDFRFRAQKGRPKAKKPRPLP